MTTAEWIKLVAVIAGSLVAWVAVAAVVGVILGRIVRNRDRQMPTDNKENKC